MELTWIERLKEMLCTLFLAWGGDCRDLGETAPQWIVAVTETYATKGAPTFSSPSAQTQFLADLALLEAHLDKPENSLSETDNAALTHLIADLEADLSAA
jgi:hypothetical protein